MLKSPKFLLIAPLLALVPVSHGLANEEGKALFGQCSACHQVGPDAKHQFGPILNGVMYKAASSVKDYDYSDALKSARDEGLVWDDTTMSEFLASPMTYVTGTKMAFPGVADESDRQKLIEYLALFDETGNSSAAVEEVAEVEPEMTEPRPLARDAVVPEHGVLHLGRIALAEEVAAWDIDVRPDGVGLPTGSGDAIVGGEIYDAQCASCHGDFGEGTGRWPVLAGGHDSLTDERPEKTIGFYDYVRRAMPYGNARSLSDDDVYAITAYLLYLNDEVDEDFELTSENFSNLRLPNEENFIADNRADEPFNVVELDDLCMSDCVEGTASVTQRAMVLDVTPDQ